MLKFFEYLFLILGIVFAVYVVSGLRSEQGMGAVDKFCAPIQWAGNVGVSLAATVDQHAEVGTDSAFTHLHYSCEYVGWRLFFEKQYEAWKKRQKLIREEEGRTATANSSMTARYRAPENVNPVSGGENIVNQGAPR